MSLKTAVERQQTISEAFVQYYGCEPALWVRAPGRVDLMGSHTDYNLGYVMTMTIDRDTWIAATPRDDEQVEIGSLNVDGITRFSLDKIKRDDVLTWGNYVRGVALELQRAGHQLCGFSGLVESTIPFGSGLSSSAAIEMATAVLFREFSHLELGPLDIARIGQRAENDFVGVSTGILDQYSSVMGQEGSAIVLDCRALTHELASIPTEVSVAVCNTRARRNLVGTEYDERRAQCEEGVRLMKQSYPNLVSLRDVTAEMFWQERRRLPELTARRCQFIIEENDRVLDLSRAFAAGDLERIRSLCADSYRGARDLYEIISPAMEAMMQAMTSAPGVIGARQAGAGFGGSMVALVAQGQEDDFASHVSECYRRQMDIVPDVYTVHAAPGAAVLELG